MSYKISFDQAGKVQISTDVGDVKRSKTSNAVQGKTPDELDAWLDSVTSLPTAKTALKELAKAVYLLNSDVKRLKSRIAAIEESTNGTSA